MDNQNINDTHIFSDGQKQNLPNATAVLVLGIISILSCICYGVVGLLCGIIALVLSRQDRNRYALNPQSFTPSSLSNLKAGRICAIIGITLSAIFLAMIILVISMLGFAIFQDPNEVLRQLQNN